MIPGTPAPSGPTTAPNEAEVEGILGDEAPPEGQEAGTQEGTEQAPESPETPPEQQQQTPPEGTPGETPPAPQPGEDGYRYAGRFEDPQALEQGYNELRTLQGRTAEERNRLRAQVQQAAAYVQQVAQAYQRQQQAQPQTPPQGAEGLDEDTLKVLQPLIDQRVEQVRQEFSQGLQQQQQQQVAQRDQEERQGAVNAFFASHPDITHGDETDQEVTSVLTELGWGPYAEELEIAHQIASDPALRKVISAIPSLADTDEGLEFAKQAAGSPPATPTRAGTEAQRRAATRAHVETGGGGTTPVTAKPKDEVDEMMAEGQKANANVFGIIPT